MKLSEMHTEMNKDERRIVLKIISDVLALGHTISVYDGEVWSVKRGTNKASIFSEMYATDQDTLLIRRSNGDKIGKVFLVYGNEGDVLCDYTATSEMELLLAGTQALYATI